jgi:thiopurine S-methyltransferase
MEASFWEQKWSENDIGFHESQVNPLLVEHFSQLDLVKGQRVFLPLCGKTLDIGWLLSKGFKVVGAELSELAIQQLFAQLEIKPKIIYLQYCRHYSANNIDIFVGDIFNLSSELLGPIDAIYDRAALVALPLALRERYSAHLISLSRTAPQLLICYEYDQNLMAGPPFSISDAEIMQHYSQSYAVNCISSQNYAGGLKGKCPAIEKVWLLN